MFWIDKYQRSLKLLLVFSLTLNNVPLDHILSIASLKHNIGQIVGNSISNTFRSLHLFECTLSALASYKLMRKWTADPNWLNLSPHRPPFRFFYPSTTHISMHNIQIYNTNIVYITYAHSLHTYTYTTRYMLSFCVLNWCAMDALPFRVSVCVCMLCMLCGWWRWWCWWCSTIDI